MEKKRAGVPVNITLSRYIFSELEKLADDMHISKSAIISLAIEKYARGHEKQKREEKYRDEK
jgi:predicted transcriptional regulator